MTGAAPLQKLRVVELARILAGPWIGQTLADLGAEVIKVEAPEGDDTRRWGPPVHRPAAARWYDRARRRIFPRGESRQDVDHVRLHQRR